MDGHTFAVPFQEAVVVAPINISEWLELRLALKLTPSPHCIRVLTTPTFGLLNVCSS